MIKKHSGKESDWKQENMLCEDTGEFIIISYTVQNIEIMHSLLLRIKIVLMSHHIYDILAHACLFNSQTMGVCSSTKNKPYDNLDLAHIAKEPTTKALFSLESGLLLDEIHEMTQIPAVKFNKIIFCSKKSKGSTTSELTKWSKNILTERTPQEYKTKAYLQKMQKKLQTKTLIELCDLSRHFINLCHRNIRVINLSEEIQRHFGCDDVSMLHSTIQILHDIGFRFVFNFLFLSFLGN